LTANIIEGVNTGFVKTLIIEGVGYRAELKGQNLLLTLGFSHTILIIPPKGITFEVASPTNIKVRGIDKQLVGLIAAKIRKIRPPEPYKGKGVRYEGEYIRRKAGKTSAK
jgi:large subunit ribosomal protein L6